MIPNSPTQTPRLRLVTLAVILAAVALVYCPSSAVAQPTAKFAYSLNIAPDDGLVVAPTNPMAQKAALWRTAQELAARRMYPVFELTNTEDPALLDWRLDINNPNFVFDAVTFISNPGADPVVTSPLDMKIGGQTSNFVQFDFTGRPLQKGEKLVFSLKIANTPGATPTMTDFSQVLWDPIGNDRTDNAAITAVWDNPVLPGQTQTFAAQPLFEYRFANMAYMDTDVTGMSNRLPGMYSDVDWYNFTFDPGLVVVPEPTSAGLWFAGGVVLLFGWGYRRALRGGRSARGSHSPQGRQASADPSSEGLASRAVLAGTPAKSSPLEPATPVRSFEPAGVEVPGSLDPPLDVESDDEMGTL